MKTKYIFPLINFAPPHNYKMSYRFPIEELENHLPKNKHTKLRTEHKHFKDGKLIKTVNSNLEFNGEKWIDQSGLYYVCSSNYNEKYDWNSSNENLENSYQLKGLGAGINLINSENYEFGFYAGRRLDKNPGRGNSGRDSDGTLKKLRYWLLFKRKF